MISGLVEVLGHCAKTSSPLVRACENIFEVYPVYPHCLALKTYKYTIWLDEHPAIPAVLI